VLVPIPVTVPTAGGTVLLQYHGGPVVGGASTIGPMTSATTSAGLLLCLSSETGSVPFAVADARGASAISEPRTCGSNTRLVFLPALRFTNGLAVPVGHILSVRLDAVGLNGSTAILRNVQFYVQRISFGNPIVTGTHVTVLRGAIATGSSSTAVLAAGNTYGIGVRMQLTRALTSSTAHVTIVVYLVDADRGVTNSVVQEWTTFAFSY
jgi:hypothetical protein